MWYQKAAEQNIPEAQNYLANAYNTGNGVPKDDEKALKFWKDALLAHYAPAQYDLAIYYIKHNRNLNEAGELIEEAALQNIKPQPQDLILFKKNGAHPKEESKLIDLVKILYHDNCDKGIAASCANFSRLQATEHGYMSAL